MRAQILTAKLVLTMFLSVACSLAPHHESNVSRVQSATLMNSLKSRLPSNKYAWIAGKIKELGGVSEAFTHAAYSGELNIVKAMIESGVDVNVLDNLKDNALKNAVLGDHADIARLLLENGAKMDAGLTVKSAKMVSVLHAAGEDFSLATMLKIVASPLSNAEVIKAALDAGGIKFINGKNKHQETMLIQAIKNNNLEAVGLLLTAGADPNVIIANPSNSNWNVKALDIAHAKLNSYKKQFWAVSDENSLEIEKLNKMADRADKIVVLIREHGGTNTERSYSDGLDSIPPDLRWW